ncbi:MAG TPA: hypothetical protein VGH38_04380 [Bryobacteraceae bacterium]
MPEGKSRGGLVGHWIGGALTLGFVVVLAGPALLMWNALRPQPWDSHALHVRYESGHYEANAVVFAYRIENRTSRSIRLLPKATRILVRQAPDTPSVGRPMVRLPLDLPARSSRVVEVRLAPAAPAATQESVANALEDLNGFEIVDETKGVHIVFPRGW